MAGKRVRCKACNAGISIPGAVAPHREAVPQIPVDEPIPLEPGESTASNPARARVDFLRYFYCYPIFPIVMGLFLVAGLTASILSGSWWILPLCLLMGGFKARRFATGIFDNIRRFKRGNVNPGVILNRSGLFNWKVAIFVDLTTRSGASKPAIYIGTFPLSRMAGGPPKAGMRVVAPTRYGGYPDRDAWSFVTPMVANCAVSNPLTLNRLMLSLGPEDWDELDRYLPRVPSHDDGLYPLWPGGKVEPIQKLSPIVKIGLWFVAVVLLMSLLLALFGKQLGII
jgi:hypothetical protein